MNCAAVGLSLRNASCFFGQVYHEISKETLQIFLFNNINAYSVSLL